MRSKSRRELACPERGGGFCEAKDGVSQPALKGEVDMSVSEWTEGLKKKEASLIYVNPSVGFADSSP